MFLNFSGVFCLLLWSCLGVVGGCYGVAMFVLWYSNSQIQERTLQHLKIWNQLPVNNKCNIQMISWCIFISFKHLFYSLHLFPYSYSYLPSAAFKAAASQFNYSRSVMHQCCCLLLKVAALHPDAEAGDGWVFFWLLDYMRQTLLSECV